MNNKNLPNFLLIEKVVDKECVDRANSNALSFARKAPLAQTIIFPLCIPLTLEFPTHSTFLLRIPVPWGESAEPLH